MIKHLIQMLYFTGVNADTCREKIMYKNSQAITDSHEALGPRILVFYFIQNKTKMKFWFRCYSASHTFIVII